MAGMAETAEKPAPTSEMSKEAKTVYRTPANTVDIVLRSVETRMVGESGSRDPSVGVASVNSPTEIWSVKPQTHSNVWYSLSLASL